jgi:hypothetical protein
VRRRGVVSIRVPRLMNSITGVFSLMAASRPRCASSMLIVRRTYCTPSRSACSAARTLR